MYREDDTCAGGMLSDVRFPSRTGRCLLRWHSASNMYNNSCPNGDFLHAASLRFSPPASHGLIRALLSHQRDVMSHTSPFSDSTRL